MSSTALFRGLRKWPRIRPPCLFYKGACCMAYPPFRTYQELFQAAEDGIRAAGMAWYREAHQWAAALATKTGYSLVQVVGVTAALSPQNRWARNQRDAKALCEANEPAEVADGGTLTTYPKQIAKALHILETSRYATTDHIAGLLGRRAFKTKAFFYSILAGGQTNRVCIDRHMIDAADSGRGIGEGQIAWTSGAKGCYDDLADAVRALAESVGLPAAQVQAVIWIAWKAEKVPF